MALAYPISKLVLHDRTTLHLLDFNLYLKWLYLSGDRHVGVVWCYYQISSMCMSLYTGFLITWQYFCVS